MNYISTRGKSPSVSASQAIINGMAPDGGLYVPEKWPNVDLDWQILAQQSYQQIATRIFGAFFDDFSNQEIQEVVQAAYGRQWDNQDIVPIHSEKHLHYLELFHGPTLAFKDIALQALPHLLTMAAKKQQLKNKLVILAATSGDTGTAAMSGFGDVDQTEIIVFYPEVGVSDIQRQQMVSEQAKNAHVIAITGNFDDAQQAVKAALGDQELMTLLAANQLQFSSANSINIGRLIPQIVYYIYAYAQLVKQQQLHAGDEIKIVVPTGNFGNVLAAFYAQQIGLPVAQFVVASNENNVLTDFFNTGVYNKNRQFKVTHSPAMDILVSSNLERLLYFASGRNAQEIQNYMSDLTQKGYYELTATTREQLSQFLAYDATDTEADKTISQVFKASRYLLDPHTAVGYHAFEQLDGQMPTLLAATASPYKFPQTVMQALDEEVALGEAGLTQLSTITHTKIPNQVRDLFKKPILHDKIIDSSEILQTLGVTLKLK